MLLHLVVAQGTNRGVSLLRIAWLNHQRALQKKFIAHRSHTLQQQGASNSKRYSRHYMLDTHDHAHVGHDLCSSVLQNVDNNICTSCDYHLERHRTCTLAEIWFCLRLLFNTTSFEFSKDKQSGGNAIAAQIYISEHSSSALSFQSATVVFIHDPHPDQYRVLRLVNVSLLNFVSRTRWNSYGGDLAGKDVLCAAYRTNGYSTC